MHGTTPVFSSPPAPKLFAVYVRDITLEDIAYRESVNLGVKTPLIKKLRDAHHKVAEMLASGMTPIAVSRVTGMCQSRISILCSDPTFQELLAFYRGDHTKARVDDVERLQMLSRSAVQELQGRVEEEPDSIPLKDLIAIAAFSADRSGLGPSSKVTNITAVLSADEIRELKNQAQSSGVTIISPQDRETRARLVDLRGSEFQAPDEQEAEVLNPEGT